MKKLIRIPVIAVLLLFISCEFENVDMGYPKTIEFPKEGGEQIVYGNYGTLKGLYIRVGSKTMAFSTIVDEVEIVQYDWLTVKSQEGSSALIFTAEPSTQESSRKLLFEGYSGRYYTSITVKHK